MLNPEFSQVLARVIADRTGIHHDPDRQYLIESRLTPLLKIFQIPSLSELGHLLERTPLEQEPWLSVCDAISTGESYFLRDRHGLDLIFSTLLPPLLKSQGSLTLLSAGCSSGEEVYSLSILRILTGFSASLSLEGIDLSPRQIIKAKEGVYGTRDVKFLDQELIERFFDHDGNWRRVKNAVRENVRFNQGNILSLSRDRPPLSVDGILCRNVVIYFDGETRRKSTKEFYQLLRKGGFLVLGSGETLPDNGIPFRQESHGGVVVFRKE
ncbi:MAG: CheR family methyltransferase [Leptospirales bacterium]